MRVDPKDGVCPSCDGVLEIVDADYATLTAKCTECGETIVVGPDGFGDGSRDYYVPFLAKKLQEGGNE